MASDSRAAGKAGHPELPAFAEDAPVDCMDGHIPQATPRVFAVLEPNTLDGSRVLDGVSLAALTAACAAGFYCRLADGRRWGEAWSSHVYRRDRVSISGK